MIVNQNALGLERIRLAAAESLESKLTGDLVPVFERESSVILQKLQTQLDAVKSTTGDNSPLARQLEIIEASGRELKTLVDTMARLCVREDLELALCNVSALIRDCLERAVPGSDEECRFFGEYRLSHRGHDVWIDIRKIAAAFDQIFKYTYRIASCPTKVVISERVFELNDDSLLAIQVQAPIENAPVPSPDIELALSRKWVELHGGQFSTDLSRSQTFKCVAVFHLPIFGLSGR